MSQSQLQNNAIILLKKINENTLAPSALSKYQRGLCVQHLSFEGWTQVEIGALLGVSRQVVIRDLKRIEREWYGYVDEYKHLNIVVGKLIATARRLICKAIRERDYSLAWKIECDLIDKLQSLGYVHKEPAKLNVEGRIKQERYDYASMSSEERAGFRDAILSRIATLRGGVTEN